MLAWVQVPALPLVSVHAHRDMNTTYHVLAHFQNKPSTKIIYLIIDIKIKTPQLWGKLINPPPNPLGPTAPLLPLRRHGMCPVPKCQGATNDVPSLRHTAVKTKQPLFKDIRTKTQEFKTKCVHLPKGGTHYALEPIRGLLRLLAT